MYVMMMAEDGMAEIEASLHTGWPFSRRPGKMGLGKKARA